LKNEIKTLDLDQFIDIKDENIKNKNPLEIISKVSKFWEKSSSQYSKFWDFGI